MENLLFIDVKIALVPGDRVGHADKPKLHRMGSLSRGMRSYAKSTGRCYEMM
jgi:hypothetical protein